MSVQVNISVGRGFWNFYRTVTFPTVPRVGDFIAPTADDRCYEVSSVTITKDDIFVRCHHHFVSQEEADEAGKEWK